MDPRQLPIPKQGLLLTHFMVVSDQDRSRELSRTVSIAPTSGAKK
jgi:hypothetical protein